MICMRKVSYVVAGIILSGCGGGSDTTPTNTSSSVVPTQSVPQPTQQFVEVSNALRMQNPYSNTITKMEVLDISGDGRDDIVVHQWLLGTNTNRGNEPCPNALKVYVMQPDNTFSDQTVSYVQGSTDLKGCSRKLRVADINQDNKLDVVLAMNNEDGRTSNNSNDFNVQNFALVSDGAAYYGQKFGVPLWYHSIGVGYDVNNKPFVMGAGYTGKDNNAYYFSNRQHIPTAVKGLENLSPNTFEFLSKSGPRKHTNLVLQGSNTFPNFGTAEGFSQNSDGSWSKVTEHNFAPTVGIAKGVSWNTQATTAHILKYKDYNLAFAAIADSCKLRMTPESEPIVVFVFSGQKVNNWDANTTIVEGGNNMSFFVGMTIKNNKVEEVPLNIQGEIVEVWGEAECKDVNNDGYDDILRYPHSKNGLPYIYLNTRNNGFKLYDISNLPSVTTSWQTNSKINATSIVHDFDKDGFVDILIYPHMDVANVSNVTYKFYRGQKAL